MTTADALVAAARRYVGTPFHHQGRLPGVGLDCAGVGICALREVGLACDDAVGYSRLPKNGVFQSWFEARCERVDFALVFPGDFLTFAWRSEPQHVAVVTDINPLMMVHAYSPEGRVIETHFDGMWQTRLRGAFRFRGLESCPAKV